jgi:hypothetical protein
MSAAQRLEQLIQEARERKNSQVGSSNAVNAEKS